MSASGTFRTSRHVRSPVAIRSKPDAGHEMNERADQLAVAAIAAIHAAQK
jgi:ribonuclease HI